MNKKRIVMLLALALVVLASAVTVAAGGGQSDLSALRTATAKYHRSEVALADGYGLVEGLDHCFENPGVGAMGYHYINTGILDTTVDETKPEALVYAPGPNGTLQLAAVEYIVDRPAWDAEGHSELPSAFGLSYHPHATLPVYILHVWVWRHNPAGIFEDWNPEVSCPTP